MKIIQVQTQAEAAGAQRISTMVGEGLRARGHEVHTPGRQLPPAELSASLHGLGRFSWRRCRYGHGRCLRLRRCGCCGHGHVRLCSRWRKVAAARWFSGGLLHRAVGRQGATVRGGCCLLALTTLTALAVAAIAVA